MTRNESFEARFERAKQANLGQVLVKAARLVNEHAIAALRANPKYAGVRLRHLAIMPHLEFDGVRITELAARMEMSKQGVGQLVTELEQVGMLERIPDPADGRAKLVRFTDVGKASLFEGLEALRHTEAELLEVLGRAELTRLHRSLSKVVAALE